ncbi:hypothetical protein ABZ079_27730 [Streptomyces sp. NPDC006314]|uniref:hypothetical protein n=1 Tax=Streptomyces sp. NPDC006314 TaxID=3154475 RepID=UPI00339E2861
MVVISPAIPSETVKPDPIEVSRPSGRISVVTMAKIPGITETAAGHPISKVVVVAGMACRPVEGRAFRCQSSGSHHRVTGRCATAPLPFTGDVAFRLTTVTQ